MLNKLKQEVGRAISGAMPSPWRRHDCIRVAIQTCDGFDEPLWTSALDRELPAWREKIELLCVAGEFAFGHAVRDAHACSTMTLTSALFRHSRLKWINALPAGVDLMKLSQPPVDVRLTTSRGIAARSMAEHAMLLLLALHKQLPAACRNQEAWKWSQEGLLGRSRDLRGLTVAVFGLGAAGSEMAKLCKAMGMRVIGVRRSSDNSDNLCDEICALTDFTIVLPRADVIFLALPLTNTTRELFTDNELRQMKRTGILVNVARGGLVREDHLAAALREGRIGGAGLDVLVVEPPAADSPLKNCPNLIVTPHIAGNLHKFSLEIAARFARNVTAFLADGPLEGLLPRDHWNGHGQNER